MEITARLMAVASFVREGAYLCDVGTDHAYLPIYLAENGRIRACLASDIHEGPCESARAHIATNGFADIIKVKRADGLSGFTPCGKTDIVIAGMGGALICEILEKAEGIKTGDVRLILQPMRNVPDLRAYLYENGFDITGEKLAREEERIYEIICAEYSGGRESAGELELLIGKKNIDKGGELLYKLLGHTRAVFSARLEGKQSAGAKADLEEKILKQIDEISTEDRK